MIQQRCQMQREKKTPPLEPDLGVVFRDEHPVAELPMWPGSVEPYSGIGGGGAAVPRGQ